MADMRLIDANALNIDGYYEHFPIVEYDYGWNGALQVIENHIEAQETIDAVPVVRCAKCKHFRRNEMDDTYCACVGGLTAPEGNDFCSYGERKDDGK